MTQLSRIYSITEYQESDSAYKFATIEQKILHVKIFSVNEHQSSCLWILLQCNFKGNNQKQAKPQNQRIKEIWRKLRENKKEKTKENAFRIEKGKFKIKIVLKDLKDTVEKSHRKQKLQRKKMYIQIQIQIYVYVDTDIDDCIHNTHTHTRNEFHSEEA